MKARRRGCERFREARALNTVGTREPDFDQLVCVQQAVQFRHDGGGGACLAHEQHVVELLA